MRVAARLYGYVVGQCREDGLVEADGDRSSPDRSNDILNVAWPGIRCAVWTDCFSGKIVIGVKEDAWKQ